MRWCPVLALFWSALSSGAPAQEIDQSADLILTGGQVRTPSGWVDAIAVRNGVIVALGSTQTVAGYRGSKTDVVELGGRTVLPGLHDMHVHSLSAGLEMTACGFPPGSKMPAIITRIEECARAAPAGAWILGGNWVGAAFATGEQSAAALDRAAPDHPVLLGDESHHSVWVNSLALKLAGINRTTPNPPGGIIDRDSAGNPTGVLRESASALVRSVIPPTTKAEKAQAYTRASQEMLRFGITSFTDALTTGEGLPVLAELSTQGVVPQRIRVCLRYDAAGGAANDVNERLIENRNLYSRPRLKVDCVKMFLDGVPTESHTAALLEPYADAAAKRDGRPKGLLLVPQAVLNAVVTRFDRWGLTLKMHATGDAAVREALDAVAAARAANGFGGPSHDMAHIDFVAPVDIPRFKQLNVTWEFSPYVWYPTPIVSDDVARAVGTERMSRYKAFRQAIDSKAIVVAGSDWSVVPSVNPWLAIETAVTRQRPGGSSDMLAPNERISLEEAFKLFTENAAIHMGDRDQVGSIDVGMRADVIVTDVNPFRIPITKVHETKVLMTFIDGHKVFDAADRAR